ncbi:hypothetical protein Tco_1474135 [Tanacetum coccineum]
MSHLSQHYGVTWTLDYAVTSFKPATWKVDVSNLRRKPLKDLGWFRWISFDYRVTLGFGSIAGGLDHVNPVIRLPLKHGIRRVLGKDDHSNPSVGTNPVTASITQYTKKAQVLFQRGGFGVAGIIGQTKDIYSDNIMDRINIDDLTIEQYLRLTQDNQTPSMVKKVVDMTIAEYIEYEERMKRQYSRKPGSYFPTYSGHFTSSNNTTI